MPRFEPPRLKSLPKLNANEVILVASGDLRLSANQVCWDAQQAMEAELTSAIEALGYKVKRAHSVDKTKKHGFIDSQKAGMDVFSGIHPEAKLIVAEAVWQYSHHVLHGLIGHTGPILTVANWSGQWPGLVGMLNLNGSLTKANVNYSTLWGEDFSDPKFTKKLKQWLDKGKVTHSTSHVKAFSKANVPASLEKLGAGLGAYMKREKAIMGVFDEGCMGMYNAIIPDHLLNATGMYKERLSQSALYYESTQVSDSEAKEVYEWMVRKGMQFDLGKKDATELTLKQVMMQCKMYIASMRIADDFGCDTIGIQYQQGLKDLMPASDLVEGTFEQPKSTACQGSRGQTHLVQRTAVASFQ
ncbi:MAG: hypothetical protein R3C03_13740 [Pirellulaceae bacterium]